LADYAGQLDRVERDAARMRELIAQWWAMIGQDGVQ